MRDVKQLIMTIDQYQFFVGRLYWGLERGIEDGGFLTVYRNDEISKINEIYVASDEFKNNDFVDMYNIEKSYWYNQLLNELKIKKQKLGYYYHTHPKILDYGEEIHEEAHTKRRIRILPGEESIERKYMKRKEREMNNAKRRLGDLVIEMLKGEKVHMHGYTPATKPYYEKHSICGSVLRETYSLEIIVPELGLKFDSFVP